jgi:integrase
MLQLKDAVEVLVDKKINDDPRQHGPTKAWLENAPPEILTKLAKYGFCMLPSTYTVQELWDSFFDAHPDMIEQTRKTYCYAHERFKSFFKQPNELLNKLTKARMEEWRRFLRVETKLAPATIAGTLSKAKAVFNWAQKEGWIVESPLKGVGRGSFRNRDKDRFIKPEEYHKLLGACDCQEWRVIISLARYGGLHPNEVLNLRWCDIDWEGNRFKVSNAKLRQYEGKYVREIPIFAEVATELEKLRLLPGNEDTGYVISRYTNREQCNLGTQFARIAKRAGLGKVPRPFDNMRASRSTEIYKQYGAKMESLWIGHSLKVALDHYLMVTDDDFAIAAGKKAVQSVETGRTPEVSEAKP